MPQAQRRAPEWLKPRPRAIAACSLVVWVQIGCSDNGTEPDPPLPSNAVASVTVDPATLSLTAGESRQLSATARTARGVVLGNVTFIWSSSDTLRARVSSGGMVSASAPGSVTITATGDGKSGTADITISVGAPAVLTAVAGDGQRALSYTPLPDAPAVRVSDRLGNPLAGVEVRFSPAAGAGSLARTEATTDAQGIASAERWITGGATGPVRVHAAVSGPDTSLSPVAFTATVTGHRPAAANFEDQLIVGYDAWFGAPGDGSAPNRWYGWSEGGGAPAPGNLIFDLYPDVREYQASDLFDTNLGLLGDGSPARVFASDREGVVDLHFKWMRENGIDGAELQMFVNWFNVESSAVETQRFTAWRASIADRVRRASEKYGRTFYISYQTPGSDSVTLASDVINSWEIVMEGQLRLTSSPAYARQDGKPVIGLWGFGFKGFPGTQEQARQLVSYFQRKGFYVIGGAPVGWRDGSAPPAQAGWADTWKQFDMVRPWFPGSARNLADLDSDFRTWMIPDKQFCDQHGIDYGLVIYPGFSWANYHPGAPRNQLPRMGGAVLWKQASFASRLSVPVFVAMFDEYNEGTAIAKAAESAAATPASQWFLTMDADGHRLSSDFYLRLTGAIGSVLRRDLPWTPEIPVPDR